MNDLNWSDYFDNDREAGCEDRPADNVKQLIAELENIYMLLEDEKYEEAYDELECQSGTISTIMKGIYSD